MNHRVLLTPCTVSVQHLAHKSLWGLAVVPRVLQSDGTFFPNWNTEGDALANILSYRAHQELLHRVQSFRLPQYVQSHNSLLLLTVESRLMPPHPHLLLQVLPIRLQALLMVLVSLQPVLATAQRVPATARPVLHTARPVHLIPPPRRHLARLLVSRLLARYTVQQVPRTPLRLPTTTLKPLANNKALRAQSTALPVQWATHPRVLNLPLDQTQGPLVHHQVLRNGRLL